MTMLISMLMLSTQVQAQESFEPDSEPVRPQLPDGTRRRYDRFNQWMKVINEFFTQGNWLNGGPSNLIEYITSTLAKLLDILMNRRGPPVIAPVEPISPPSTDDTIEYKVLDSNGRQRQSIDRYREPIGNRPKIQLNLNDIIRMIPTNQLNR